MRVRVSVWYCGVIGKVLCVVSCRVSGVGISNCGSLVGIYWSWCNGEGCCWSVKYINGNVLGIWVVVFCIGYCNDLWIGGSRCKLIVYYIGVILVKGVFVNIIVGCCY